MTGATEAKWVGSCRECNYLNYGCGSHDSILTDYSKDEFRVAQRIKFTNDIVEGYVVHALKGEGGEIVKPYGLTGCEWIVHTNFGKRLKVNERQIELF